MANYFYATGTQQNGPVPEDQLDQLAASGQITPETLIWTEGMAGWEPYATARGGGAGASVAAPVGVSDGAVVCNVCGQTYSADQVVRYGTMNVCGSCKPRFLQGQREGLTTADLDYAGFWVRFGAKIIDGILMFVVNLGATFLLAMAMGVQTDSTDMTFVLGNAALTNALSLAYTIFMHGKFGQTLGKMALKIKVVTPDGAPIGFGRATGRAFAEILSGLILMIGYIMAAFDSEKRSLHDRLAGTRVVRVK